MQIKYFLIFSWLFITTLNRAADSDFVEEGVGHKRLHDAVAVCDFEAIQLALKSADFGAVMAVSRDLTDIQTRARVARGVGNLIATEADLAVMQAAYDARRIRERAVYSGVDYGHIDLAYIKRKHSVNEALWELIQQPYPLLSDIQTALNSGADIDTPDMRARTILMHSARRGNLILVKALLSFGAKIDVQDCDGYTALMWAADRGEEAVVAPLLRADASVNLVDHNGLTALTHALVGGHTTIAKKLLSAGANVADGVRDFPTVKEFKATCREERAERISMAREDHR